MPIIDGILYLDGDDNADWIKRVEGGKYQKEEIEANEILKKKI